ncbi:hypothetical protein [uncultured Campylobacter sp.]|uniref:hypothetical protein n=1 Tax=uncultured Campylobacter sp. TaxID=218934 RepID=UPI002628B580|nr:hypothetical protein [uncultured Campylobacter sp.]
MRVQICLVVCGTNTAQTGFRHKIQGYTELLDDIKFTDEIKFYDIEFRSALRFKFNATPRRKSLTHPEIAK